MIELAAATWLLAQAVHADCFTKTPSGNIRLHQCQRAQVRSARTKQAPVVPKRKILVVPTGREFSI